ncbi:hypothetical protein NDU88_001142 [Pleurodeles waltl]|uniref:Uncharacterized protein n=1 Tax=Pleurodeles waltl TaxID=8319 RepID=A0AAV7S7S6_PLEWA|nr:hypothetical protein NDU88_001142 [Pleurodeles waltl]
MALGGWRSKCWYVLGHPLGGPLGVGKTARREWVTHLTAGLRERGSEKGRMAGDNCKDTWAEIPEPPQLRAAVGLSGLLGYLESPAAGEANVGGKGSPLGAFMSILTRNNLALESDSNRETTS